jgi:hypothetical protein
MRRLLYAAMIALILAPAAYAGPVTLVTTDVSFLVSGGATADKVIVVYTPPVDPVTFGPHSPGLSLISDPGGVPNSVEADFAPASFGSFFWTFTQETSLPPIDFAKATLGGVTDGMSGTVSVAVSASIVPEPAEWVTLGTAMLIIPLWFHFRRALRPYTTRRAA